MSHVSIRPVAKGEAPNLEAMLDVGPRLLAASMASARALAREATQILQPAMPALTQGMQSLRPRPMCDIPEQDCPPHCAAAMTWTANQGETVRCTIRVTNTAKTARPFTLTPTAFTGRGNPATVAAVSPGSFTLGAGQTQVATATLTVTPDFLEGQSYEGEIRVQGAYEQGICITLRVQGDDAYQVSVSQGDPPVRIRAHRWYDHFQCVESCAPEKYPAAGISAKG